MPKSKRRPDLRPSEDDHRAYFYWKQRRKDRRMTKKQRSAEIRRLDRFAKELVERAARAEMLDCLFTPR